MSESPARGRARLRPVEVLAVALIVFTALYRFNTLGGALGGFDNDHFVPFAYAKQVEAGEQPVRDFAGAGLQGAWPSLTFELSAWAQRLLGDSLRSEALLSVGGLALAAAATFRAAALVSPLFVAFGATLLSILIEPKLYSYPKVLVLALAAWGCMRYVRVPRGILAALLGLLTAAAFLFRHDFAVYVAAAVLTALAVAGEQSREWSRAVRHAAGWMAVTAVCLAPAAWFLSRDVGIRAYIEDSVFAVQQESRRTTRIERGVVWTSEDGRRLTARTFFDEDQNAGWWLFYSNAALPLLVLVGAAVRAKDHATLRRLAPVVVMTLLVVPSFLRGNTAARVSDLAPLMAVLWSAALVLAFGAERWRPVPMAVALVTVAGLGITVQSAWAVGNVSGELDTSGWSDSPGKIASQARRRWEELGALPAAYWSGEARTPSMRAVQYLHECTAPGDRVIVLSYQPGLLPLADRRFGGAGFGLVPGLLFLYRNQATMISHWRRESVPIVLMQTGPEDQTEIPFLLEYLRARYRDAGSIEVDSGPLRVFADTGRTPVRSYGDAALPCFN